MRQRQAGERLGLELSKAMRFKRRPWTREGSNVRAMCSVHRHSSQSGLTALSLGSTKPALALRLEGDTQGQPKKMGRWARLGGNPKGKVGGSCVQGAQAPYEEAQPLLWKSHAAEEKSEETREKDNKGGTLRACPQRGAAERGMQRKDEGKINTDKDRTEERGKKFFFFF